MRVEELSIRNIINMIVNGEVRIPAFQRGFVWEPERVAFLLDSIHKGYPFGSVLLWRSKEEMKAERKLGPFDLPGRKADYPLFYVLDGQQRITSIFGVFQTELTPTAPAPWTNVYFDLAAKPDARESQFLVLALNEVDPSRHFPLRTIFDPVKYREASAKFNSEQIIQLDKMQTIFKEARIPAQITSATDRATVAIVFERVNRQGVALDTLQLLSAWTWSDQFHLQTAFAELSEEFEPFGFKDVGEDITLLLRCCAAVVAGDAAPETLVEVRGDIVRDRFEEIANGIRGAIDFLRRNFHVEKLDNLPYSTLLVPLTVFFAIKGTTQVLVSAEQAKTLVRWFWRSCYSRRYSSGTLRYLKTDIEEMNKLRAGERSELGNFPVSVGVDFYLNNAFRIDSVNSKTFILQLARRAPLNLISNTPVDLRVVLREYNRNEFHHLYPKAFMKGREHNQDIDCLANIAFLSKAENNKISGSAPSAYRQQMPVDVDDILGRMLAGSALFGDDYDDFVEERSRLLADDASPLIG
ncbi:DUF262 domain-containing protein [Myxococcus sp. XM-1-1-1]|uniref:DUF262 domain-containing protein n=1 Tax=Myxococcus sp. XM-1-1-1 TaxID=2874602 RepID=UPI001CBDDB3F|nr:DUF262 domain-containing protein [Myxococcus sp. XM-1-1-1]MBZ4410569.1 DUF262 domain-containing protein [Myxococcus sp. XM-1-1-1]